MRRLASAFILLIAIAHSSSILFAGAAGDAESVILMVGRSAVLDTGAPIARVSLTSADVADALVTSAQQVLINGKMPGTISLFVWDRGGALKRYEVVVQRDLARLSEQLNLLFPGEAITAHSNGKAVVLAGSVTNKDVIDKAASVAGGYVDKKEDVVSLLQVRDSGGSNQVLLRVRFAEVSRSALTELGVNFFTSPTGYKNVQGRVTTQQFPAPVFDMSSNDTPKLVFSDYLNFFLWDFKNDLGAVIKALQVKGLLQSLAEPNLVAESGKEASFLAGGEVPVPIAQPGAGGTAVTVMYKEFGIRLNFTPVVNGERIHLKVKPEVSSLDFANAVTLSGFRIPAMTTRRMETELELQNGQTFAIAGLINNTMNKSMQKVPGIGDIPILGLLFKSQAAQKDRIELVVMITPEILPRSSNGVTPNLPRLQEPYLPTLDPKKSLDSPAPAYRPSATGSAQQQDNKPAPQTAATPVPAAPAQTPPMNPADAAATMRALTPSSPPVVKTPAPTPAPQAAPPAPIPAQERALTPQEQATLDRARAEEAHARGKNSKEQKASKSDKSQANKFDRSAHEPQSQPQPNNAKAASNKEASKEIARQAEADRKRLEEEQKAAKRQAAIEKAAADTAEKRAAEQAKKQAEVDKKQAESDKKNGKAVADAEAKLKAAQAAYEAEVARSKKQQQQQQ